MADDRPLSSIVETPHGEGYNEVQTVVGVRAKVPP
jgi:hypothetical protein